MPFVTGFPGLALTAGTLAGTRFAPPPIPRRFVFAAKASEYGFF